ncbi:hypothetical protein [Yersinia massiliensis]|uniref:hypothetical protein n=1 Tax=Yersinia massiliensis TaxID=419257 RepID=UPI0011A1172D|nr:hypothetical protein [Yersinia massiliensis]HDL6777765.1 hypothetical protein [Yersinia enterocolitica]HDL8500529.1 hypothetical protein [Yersinia enterocolitica]
MKNASNLSDAVTTATLTDSSTATLTVRNIPFDVDVAISEQAKKVNKSKSDFLKEFLTQEFQDLIKNFGRTNQLVDLMDIELSNRFKIKLAKDWYENHMISHYNREEARILGLKTYDDLQQLMMRNMPYLFIRADQVLHEGFAYIPRGLSLTFSIFNEIASRDEHTINSAYERVFHMNGAEIFYDDINIIRKEMKLPQIDRM